MIIVIVIVLCFHCHRSTGLPLPRLSHEEEGLRALTVAAFEGAGSIPKLGGVRGARENLLG